MTEMFPFTGKMCSTEYGVKAFFIFSEIEFGSPQKEGRQGASEVSKAELHLAVFFFPQEALSSQIPSFGRMTF